MPTFMLSDQLEESLRQHEKIKVHNDNSCAVHAHKLCNAKL